MPQEAGPAQEAQADRLDLIEPEFTQLDDVEQRAELSPNLLLSDNGRPWVVRLAGVACQHQGHGLRSGQMAKRLQVRRHVLAADHVIAAAVEDKVERAGQHGRRMQHIGHQEADAGTSLLGSPACVLDGYRAQVERGDLKALLRQPNGAGSGAAAQLQGPAWANGELGDDTLQLGRRLSRLPGRVALRITLVPANDVGHWLLLRWLTCAAGLDGFAPHWRK